MAAAVPQEVQLQAVVQNAAGGAVAIRPGRPAVLRGPDRGDAGGGVGGHGGDGGAIDREGDAPVAQRRPGAVLQRAGQGCRAAVGTGPADGAHSGAQCGGADGADHAGRGVVVAGAGLACRQRAGLGAVGDGDRAGGE